MNTKHTPGPWNIAPKTATYKLCVPDDLAAGLKAAGIQIEFQALSVGTAKSGSAAIIPLDESNIENARLIAAAPELLEALQGMIENDGGKCSKRYNAFKLFDAREAAREAIAKATGSAA